MYYRLQADRLLPPRVERVLYLDADLIVRKSLQALWDELPENCYLAAAMPDEQPQFNVAKFARATKSAITFYENGASEEDRQRVAKAIRKAARRIKKAERNIQEGGQDEQAKLARQQATAEKLAAGLYKVLSESGSVKVKGNPASGASTRIQGPVDLNEVARRLLSLA